MTLATERLVLQPVAPADHAVLHVMFTEAGVRRVIFDDEIIPSEQTAEIIRTSGKLLATEGCGLWAARLAEVMIGFGGLWYFREPPELELLYGVRDAYVKRGYGREIARAIVRYGFDVLNMNEIRASTHPTHADSRRVLEDLGFTLERQAIVGGLDTVFYKQRVER
jgi:ribosomal-protein-alanine N-acetyltransferase